MKIIIGSDSNLKFGNISQEILDDAKAAGLSERGVDAVRTGDKQIYREELRRLERERMGSIWACTTGYGILYANSSEAERQTDYRRADRQLAAISKQIPPNVDVVPESVARNLHDQICDMQ